MGSAHDLVGGARMTKLDRRTAALGLGAVLSSGWIGRSAAAPARPDLYRCEGCEAVGERGREAMTAIADIAGPDELGERLVVEGRVLEIDGVTPAADIVIYAHQANAEGLYANGTDASMWSRRHGRLRGWARTGADGAYRFNTIKPAPYPDMTMPAHIHLMIGEAGRRPYYIDAIVFDGEFGVTAAYRRGQEFRGGSGIVRLARTADGVWRARRDIVLESHPE
jgi:protocatechuate 3,4-dioxygenase beta subunit